MQVEKILKMHLPRWATAAAFALCATTAHAGLITGSGLLVGGAIDDYHFSVTATGVVTMHAAETVVGDNGAFVFDTEINLFRDDGSLDLSDFIANNDDGGGGPNNFESLIVLALDAGNYLLRVGNFNFGGGLDPVIIAAVNTEAASNRQSDYTLSIMGDFVVSPVASVPEPTALSLLGLGLAAIGFARRLRRS